MAANAVKRIRREGGTTTASYCSSVQLKAALKEWADKNNVGIGVALDIAIYDLVRGK